jgi:hypothetical protein
MRDVKVDPISPLLNDMIRHLVNWNVLTKTCIPDSCIIINIYDKGDCIPPLSTTMTSCTHFVLHHSCLMPTFYLVEISKSLAPVTSSVPLPFLCHAGEFRLIENWLTCLCSEKYPYKNQSV